MNNGIETKVAAGGITGLALGLLYAALPSVRHAVSPQFAPMLPPLAGAVAAYFAPHTPRLGDPSTVVQDVITGMDRLLAAKLGPRAPQPAPPPPAAPAPAPVTMTAAPPPQATGMAQ